MGKGELIKFVLIHLSLSCFFNALNTSKKAFYTEGSYLN